MSRAHLIARAREHYGAAPHKDEEAAWLAAIRHGLARFVRRCEHGKWQADGTRMAFEVWIVRWARLRRDVPIVVSAVRDRVVTMLPGDLVFTNDELGERLRAALGMGA